MVQIVEQTSPGGNIGQSLGQGISNALQMLVNQKLETLQQDKQRQEAIDQYEGLLKRGFTAKEAALWLQFTEGGKTNLSKEIVERMQREGGFERRGIPPTPQTGLELLEGEEGATPSSEPLRLERETLTPKEKTTREETRYKTNLPLFQATKKKMRGHESEGISIQRLQELNKTGRLPTGLQRLNVNFESGELRFPFLANADTQAFVKTINDFTTKAKESFGARVTNFELNRFMKRLPTLLNTEEGREVILRQMEIVNEINTLYDQATLDTLDRVGGVRKIDWDQAQRSGEKKITPMIKKLKKEFVGLESKSSKLQTRNQKEIQQPLKKVAKGTPLTEDVVDKLLDQANGDIDQAKKLARKLGYEF